MDEYEEVMAKIAELQAKAAEIRASEMKSAIAQIKGLMDKHGITIADIQGKVSKAKKLSAARAIYRDPASGKEWNGHGREPNWIKGKNREELKI